MNQATWDFITAHMADDVYTISLKAKQYPDVDMGLALQQIEARQRCAKKLPTMVASREWLFASRLPLEQCSSESTARYKAAVIAAKNCGHESLADLTGGMGVDTFFCSQHFSHTTYVERNTELCDLARHNFRDLPVDIVCADSTEHLRGMEHADVILIDPARRGDKGQKTVMLEDCTPDVTQIIGLLRSKSTLCLIKLSPMIDATQALRSLSADTDTAEIHYVGSQGECKEVLLVLGTTDGLQVVHEDGVRDFVFRRSEEEQALPVIAQETGAYLHVPSPVMLKAAPYKLICSRYGMAALAANTHLYTSDTIPADWHGKSYRIEAVHGMGKTDIRTLKKLGAANIIVRNAPLTTDILRKKLCLGDGGDIYLFAARISSGEIRIIQCRRA